MLVAQEVEEEDANENIKHVNAGVVTEGDVSVAHDEGRMIADMDANTDVVLEEVKEVAADAKADQEEATVNESVDIQGRTADAARTTVAVPKLTAPPRRRTKGVLIWDPKESSTTTSIIIPAETKSKDNGKWILVEEPKPLKKQAQIKQDEKYARELEAELNRTIYWDEVIEHVKMKAKEDPTVKRYQALKRKPQTEAQVRKTMMVYLKNVVGFKMDYFKEMSNDDIRLIFERYFDSNVSFLQKIEEQIKEEESRALKRINETSA
nr:hypothetical protein [Tanacetum cinerariifolium]